MCWYYISLFKLVWKSWRKMEELISLHTKLANKSAFIIKIPVQISSFWSDFLGSVLLIDFLNSFVVANLKPKKLGKPFLGFVTLVLEWILNFLVIFKTILLLRFVTLLRSIRHILNRSIDVIFTESFCYLILLLLEMILHLPPGFVLSAS